MLNILILPGGKPEPARATLLVGNKAPGGGTTEQGEALAWWLA